MQQNRSNTTGKSDLCIKLFDDLLMLMFLGNAKLK